MAIEIRVSGRYLLENEYWVSVQGKQLIACVTNEKIQVLSKKNFFWGENLCSYYELECVPIFKDFSDELSGDMNKCDF